MARDDGIRRVTLFWGEDLDVVVTAHVSGEPLGLLLARSVEVVRHRPRPGEVRAVIGKQLHGTPSIFFYTLRRVALDVVVALHRCVWTIERGAGRPASRTKAAAQSSGSDRRGAAPAEGARLGRAIDEV